MKDESRVLYSVRVAVDQDVAQEWEVWMRDVHIPDVLRTGCFVQMIWGEVAPSPAESPRRVWRMDYYCEDDAELARYNATFAPALKADHTARYAGRVMATRQTSPVRVVSAR